MKKFLFFLVLVVVVAGGIYYFAPWQSWSVFGFLHSTNKKPAILATGTFSTSTGSNAMNAVRDFVTNSGEVLGTSISNFVGGAVTNAENAAKETVIQQVANMLGVSTTVNSASGSSVVVLGAAAGFEVCSAHKKNETVGYLLEFPTSTTATEYKVDWGDNQTTQNSAPASAHSVLVSHSYGSNGSYSVTFRVSGSSAILAQKEVCVQ